MKQENINALEQLSLISHLCGLITIFIGIVVCLLLITNEGFEYVNIGLFILITGYAFVKISSKISKILSSEKNSQLQNF